MPSLVGDGGIAVLSFFHLGVCRAIENPDAVIVGIADGRFVVVHPLRQVWVW